jgi:hypothetical protein
MTTPRAITTYGGPFEDLEPVSAPENEQPATEYNRHAEDTAQLTQCAVKACFDFLCVASGTVSAADVNCRQHYGTGSSTKPVVARTALGTYTATFASDYLDGLAETETWSIFKATGTVESGTVFGHVQVVITSATVLTIYTADMTGALADYTVGTKVGVFAV